MPRQATACGRHSESACYFDSPPIISTIRSVTTFNPASISASSRGGLKTYKCRLNGISYPTFVFSWSIQASGACGRTYCSK